MSERGPEPKVKRAIGLYHPRRAETRVSTEDGLFLECAVATAMGKLCISLELAGCVIKGADTRWLSRSADRDIL